MCSLRFIAGDIPTVVPPYSFAPIVASSGSPGHAPENKIMFFSAIVFPSSLAANLACCGISPLAEPITPIWYLLIIFPLYAFLK
ncbi:MAG: hypothetical protein AMQ74_00677 [Candidatus Methanofastidiosum methylothiophilum]|uniref:Uncharacterized protein n=1 Tax=Candidatus Methanofastidiosum methylothiophilum TaxID=1705564 RepID=A0A150J5X6_9EURY|nr:MAG: hypothetical protein AMQ74_00677 [Candidatus Methanofastidiosum methylthiophilus]